MNTAKLRMLKIILIIVCIFVLLNQNLAIEFCQKSPPWRLNNYSFYRSEKVHIKLVALLKSSCGFCKKQAEGYLEIIILIFTLI